MKRHLITFLCLLLVLVCALGTLAVALAVEPQEDPQRTDNTLVDYALALGEDIGMKVTAYFEEGGTYGLLAFPEGAGEPSYAYDPAYALTVGERVGENTVYTLDGIAAKRMTDKWVLRTYRYEGGSYTYGERRTVSVQANIAALRTANAAQTNPYVKQALDTLCCAALNYGAAAQTYFDYKTDDLANSVLGVEEQKIPANRPYQSVLGVSGTTELPDVFFKSVSLVLGEKPCFKLYVVADAPASLTLEMAITPSFEEPSRLPVQADGTVVTEGLLPAEMGQTFFFRLRDGQSYSSTLAYSAETYADRKQENETVKPLTDALFAYTDAAVAYGLAAAAMPSDTQVVTPAVFLDDLRAGSLQGTYLLSEELVLTESATFDGKGATVYASAGVRISGTNGLTLKNLTVCTASASAKALTVENASATVLEGLTLNGVADKGILAEEGVDGLVLRGVHVSAGMGTVMLGEDARDVYVLDRCVLQASLVDATENGVYAEGNNVLAQVTVSANGTELRGNLLGTVLVDGAENVLVAGNTVNGGIAVEGSDNVVLVKNTAGSSAVTITATTSKHLYIIENYANRMTLTDNNYLIADLNMVNSMQGTARNQNQNGDNVTYVYGRAQNGVNEELLPHTDKDQFVGAARKTTVRTASGYTASFNDYVTSVLSSQGEDAVFIAPGVYSTSSQLTLSGLANKTVYAYGVMMERQSGLDRMLQISGGSNGVAIRGLTIGFAQQMGGQVYILEKNQSGSTYTFRVKVGAGTGDYFASSGEMGWQKALSYYDYEKTGNFYAISDQYFDGISSNGDGTMTMTFNYNGEWDGFAPGDVLTCRANGGSHTVYIEGSSNVSFRDVNMYGNSGSFAFCENYNLSATSYYRVLNTSRSRPVITEELYKQYCALEQQYDISFDLAIDEEGRYRGSLPRLGSVDAVHATGCAQGVQMTSCLLENMCDDGTNQNHLHARLAAEFVDNGNGTTTIWYKGNSDQVRRSATGFCADFKVGDRVYIYGTDGVVFCDTVALSATQTHSESTIRARYGGTSYTGTQIKSVTVATSALQGMPSLSGYDLARNDVDDQATPAYTMVFVDNMSMASANFFYDNVLVQNTRSRGFLIKASATASRLSVGDNELESDMFMVNYGEIRNCTFRNLGMAAIALHYEFAWGESGVSRNVRLLDNEIENTGYFKLYDRSLGWHIPDKYSPISVLGLGTPTEGAALAYDNITIKGNVIRDRHTNYAVYVKSATNVSMTGNDFGDMKAGVSPDQVKYAVCLENVGDAVLSDNTYPDNGDRVVQKGTCLNITNKDD